MGYSARDVKAMEEFTIDQDDLWPRDDDHRFRLYFRNANGLHVVAAASSIAGVGWAIQSKHEEQKQDGLTLGDLGQIGVLDTCPEGSRSETGEWIINPFTHV